MHACMCFDCHSFTGETLESYACQAFASQSLIGETQGSIESESPHILPACLCVCLCLCLCLCLPACLSVCLCICVCVSQPKSSRWTARLPRSLLRGENFCHVLLTTLLLTTCDCFGRVSATSRLTVFTNAKKQTGKNERSQGDGRVVCGKAFPWLTRVQPCWTKWPREPACTRTTRMQCCYENC